MPIAVVTVDSFSSQRFAGNPAAVCVLDRPAAPGWMQLVAREMNLSETAFVVKPAENASQPVWGLRWFTPAIEVDLCGHATLAAAHHLWEGEFVANSEPICFSTRSGILTCRRRGTAIAMDFPAETLTETAAPPALERGLKTTPTWIARTSSDYFCVLPSPRELRQLAPDFSELSKIATRGIIVTSPSDDPSFHFLSRFFAPAAGIWEDPVTGSAHCALAPYWYQRLGTAVPPEGLVAYQASPRGGVVRIKLGGDRVTLTGEAVTMLRGELLVDPQPAAL